MDRYFTFIVDGHVSYAMNKQDLLNFVEANIDSPDVLAEIMLAMMKLEKGEKYTREQQHDANIIVERIH